MATPANLRHVVPSAETCLFRSRRLVGSVISRVAVAVSPLPPSADVTFPVVLTLVPVDVPVTVTVMVHVAPAASEAPDSWIVDGAVRVMVPPQADEPSSSVTVTPAGRMSVKPTPLRAAWPLGLPIVRDSSEVPSRRMAAGAKVLAMTGGAITEIVSMA